MPFCINTVHDLSMIILVTDLFFVTGYTLYLDANKYMYDKIILDKKTVVIGVGTALHVNGEGRGGGGGGEDPKSSVFTVHGNR